jgi:hypothetical protein
VKKEKHYINPLSIIINCNNIVPMNLSKVKDICNTVFSKIKSFFPKGSKQETLFEIAYDDKTGESLYMKESHKNHVLNVMVAADEWQKENKWTPHAGERLELYYAKHRQFTTDEYRKKLFKD